MESGGQGWADSGPKIQQWLADATAAMLAMAAIKHGDRVLDVAAGAGAETLDIAARVGAAGHALATDLSPDILERAKAAAADAGYRNVDIRVSDGEKLQVESEVYDAAVCRLGLMLFQNPLQGLEEMRRALKPGGGICVMVFSSPDASPASPRGCQRHSSTPVCRRAIRLRPAGS